MFYVVFLVKKKADLTQDEFTRYWIDEHTPLTAKLPGLRAYHCFPMIGHDGGEPPFDAIAYVAFEDEAAWREAERGPELAAALADAPNFQTVEDTVSFYAERHVVV